MRTRTSSFSLVCLAFSLSLLCPRPGSAYDHLVEKKVFEVPAFTTTGGDVLKDVRFGYEMYGELNAAKDNAILILPYFSGTGHAAGKFAASDPQPGYWDSIIGPGKPLDTDRFASSPAMGLSTRALRTATR